MDINIYIITELQKNILINSENGYIKFAPIQDINNNYLISENEYFFILGLWYLDECPTELIFIKDLSLTIYEPKIIENPLI
jgi:hypothetical protein